MAFEPSDEITFRLPAAEVDELISAATARIKWTQQIIAKLMVQAQAQQPHAPGTQPQNGGVRPKRPGNAAA